MGLWVSMSQERVSRVTGAAAPIGRSHGSEAATRWGAPAYGGDVDILEQLLAVIGVFVVLTVAVVAYQRGLDKPGGRPPGGHGDVFNPVNEIFHPAAHRASEELKRYDEKVETVPSPDDEEPGGTGLVRLVRDSDGSLRGVRISRRP